MTEVLSNQKPDNFFGHKFDAQSSFGSYCNGGLYNNNTNYCTKDKLIYAHILNKKLLDIFPKVFG